MPEPVNFYSAWYCPFAQRTWAALEHLGIPYIYLETDPYHKSTEWLEISRGTGQVPVLEFGKREAGKPITEAFLKWHGLSGNKAMTPNVTNQIHILSRDGALSGGKLSRDHIYANAVHTVDGTWNMDGRAMTNEQLGEAISKG